MFLNSEIPSKFRIEPKKINRITPLQCFYMGNCIKYEEFINSNIGDGLSQYALHVLLFQLAEDMLTNLTKSKTYPNPPKKVKRTLREQFNYIDSIDFSIICDLKNCIL